MVLKPHCLYVAELAFRAVASKLCCLKQTTFKWSKHKRGGLCLQPPPFPVQKERERQTNRDSGVILISHYFTVHVILEKDKFKICKFGLAHQRPMEELQCKTIDTLKADFLPHQRSLFLCGDLH